MLVGTINPLDSLPPEKQAAIKSHIEHLKKKSNAGSFDSDLSSINSLLPNSSLTAENKTYVEVKIDGLQIPHPISLKEHCSNMCVTFQNSKFDRIHISHSYPSKFINCEIKEVTIDSHLANLHFENCTLNIIKPKSTNPIKHVGFYGGKIGIISSNTQAVSHLTIIDCRVKELAFQKSTIAHTKFINVEFEEAPSFIDAKLEKTVFFNRCSFHEFTLDAQAFYRELRKHMHDNNDEEAANQFGSLELQAKHALLSFKNDPQDWLISHTYKLINNFGSNTYKPLTIIGLQFGLSFFVFLLLAKEKFLYLSGEQAFGEYGQALFLAFCSAIGPLRLLVKMDSHSPTHIFGEMTFLFFNIASTLLWFFLILGIRKKYKLN